MVQNGKVKIYLADIRPLFDETMQKKALAQLDEVRRQKALSCRQTKQRAASLTAGLLAEEAKRRNGFDGCPVCYTKNGQPYLFIQDGRRAFLSLSHSGDYAVFLTARWAWIFSKEQRSGAAFCRSFIYRNSWRPGRNSLTRRKKCSCQKQRRSDFYGNGQSRKAMSS